MARQSGYDRHITIFSPEGRLHQVEYAFQAVKKNQNMTSVALRGDDSVVAVTQKKVPDKLMDKDFGTHLYNITPNVGCLMTGMSPDARALVYRAREIAAKFKDKNAYEIPVHYLALKLANIAQVYTQHAYMRPYGVSTILVSIDDEKGPSLYQIDPAGQYFGYKAAAAGTKDQEAQNALEKIVKKKIQFTEAETIQQAIGCLQAVMGMDFKASDIEVGVVSKRRRPRRPTVDAQRSTCELIAKCHQLFPPTWCFHLVLPIPLPGQNEWLP
ncbi:Proteasome subunit alpha type-6 [Durusdinium trenchii]|uniref:Proteasome subunit alpha type n=1 Tax=Durusdinium trenchii TaxID=1381693 RepID=A0ABP0HI90_9DINO